MAGCRASPDCSKAVGCCEGLSLEERVQMYTHSPCFRRETIRSTGERGGRSSWIYAHLRGANALLLRLDLAPVVCGG